MSFYILATIEIKKYIHLKDINWNWIFVDIATEPINYCPIQSSVKITVS
jgi:hypothetical protein